MATLILNLRHFLTARGPILLINLSLMLWMLAPVLGVGGVVYALIGPLLRGRDEGSSQAVRRL